MRRTLLRAARDLPAPLVVLALLLPSLGEGSLWIDEVRSLSIGRDVGAVLHALRHEEANMGLYYLLLVGWRALGESDGWVRALSLLAALASLPLVRSLGARAGGRGAGVAAAVLLAAHGGFLEAAREVRGYAWMVALALAASWALARAVRRSSGRGYLAWAILAALAFHAHALASVVVLAHLVALLAAREEVSWRAVAGALALLVAGVVPLWMAQAGGAEQLAWIVRRPLGASLVTLGERAGGGHEVLAWAWLAVAAAGVVVLARRPRTFARALALALAVVPPLALVMVDRAVQPLFLARYAIVVVPGLALAAGAAVAALARALRGAARRRETRSGAAVVGALSARSSSRAAGATALLFVAGLGLSGLDLRPREDWRAAAEHIRAGARPEDVVVVFAYFCRPALERYLGTSQTRYSGTAQTEELASAPYPPEGGGRLPDPDLARLEALARARGRVWLVSSHHRFPRLGRDDQHRAIVERLQRTLGPGASQSFRGVRVTLFEAQPPSMRR